MKLFGICLVKNEEDIVAESLNKAAQWCDCIFVYDTGSSDRTWAVVKALAREKPDNIFAFRQRDQPFSDEIRAEVFNERRDLAEDGDWWCRLDADEIYIDNPRGFLTGVPSAYNVVHNLSLQYYFTEEDERAWLENPQQMNATPVEARMRYYVCNHSEARFFRYRRRLQWLTGPWPRHMGLVYPARIRLKHFQYRSPAQIARRLQTRMEAIRSGYKPFASYDEVANWRDKIVPSATLHQDDGSGEYIIDPVRLPKHLERPAVRVAKVLLHASKIWP